MEKKRNIKEKARLAFIREKASQVKDKSRHKYSVPGIFAVIDGARALEHYDPEPEESNSAADSVEHKAISTLSKAEIAVRYARHKQQRNASHRETHSEPEPEAAPEAEILHSPDKADRPYRKKRETATARRSSRQPSGRSQSTYKQTPIPKAQTHREQGRRLAQGTAIRETVQKQSRRDMRLRKLKAAVERAARASTRSALAAGGGLFLLILPLLLLFGAAGALFGGSTDIGNAPVSDEVRSYAGLIQIYAMEHGIPEYAELIAAVMMQESGGRGNDPMQASECAFNTEYPKTPGGITDRSYSISVGIQALADCLTMAGVESPEDIERISLALQGYNFGSGYISWAMRNYGGYSELNAMEFSEIMAQRMGWPSYGDPQYVQHVLKWYMQSDPPTEIK